MFHLSIFIKPLFVIEATKVDYVSAGSVMFFATHVKYIFYIFSLEVPSDSMSRNAMSFFALVNMEIGLECAGMIFL